MYIPKESLVKQENERKVYEIIDNLNADLVQIGEEYRVEDAIRDLEAIGETIISNQLKTEYL